MLDCFSGMGGVSDGFALEGFDVTGIDIVDAPKMLGYKHRFIQADMTQIDGMNYRNYDVIWGSPPCRDFSQLGRIGVWRWKRPFDPVNGLFIVRNFIEFCRRANPKIWIMENTPELLRYWPNLTPVMKAKLTPTMERMFWGDFPNVKIQMELRQPIKRLKKGSIRSWERAKIPLGCSRAFARACREALMEKVTAT